MLATISAQADKRFTSSYSCSDASKYCISSGIRTVEGFEVHRDCWEYAYTKTCNYPSLNNCATYAHCYSLGQRDCLLRDSSGNCVNIKKEFSCKRWEPTYVESETVRYGFEDKEGVEGLVCEGIPCFDGNCLDKSYEMDSDMVSSVAQLGALSQGKNVEADFKLFEGAGRQCSKKGTGYSNCCQIYPKGWGKKLGTKCSEDEQILSEQRDKKLCVGVGTTNIEGVAGQKFGTKHHYCCFGNMLEKVIQVEARKQLGINFGSGGNKDCRGLTLKQLEKVDFSKMDFSEVAAEIQKKIVMPNIKDIESRINDSFKDITEFDENEPAHPKNKYAGVNQALKGDAREIAEAKELEEERSKIERQRQLEIQQAQVKQQKIAEAKRREEERLERIRIEEEKKQFRAKIAPKIYNAKYLFNSWTPDYWKNQMFGDLNYIYIWGANSDPLCKNSWKKYQQYEKELFDLEESFKRGSDVKGRADEKADLVFKIRQTKEDLRIESMIIGVMEREIKIRPGVILLRNNNKWKFEQQQEIQAKLNKQLEMLEQELKEWKD